MTMHDDAVVRADDLSLGYRGALGSRLFVGVSGIDLRVAPGEVLGIVGESGSGQSTLAKAVAALRRRRAGDGVPVVVGGSLAVLGREVRGGSRRSLARVSARIGYLPQQAGRSLPAGLTVAEIVAAPLFARDRTIGGPAAGRRAAEVVDAVQLPLGVMAKFAYELSSGQRQRVAIARSLVLEPELWVADEPTAGVDVTARAPVLQGLLEHRRELGLTAVIVSHDAAIMSGMTDRVAVLHRGALAGVGTLDSLLATGATPVVVHPYVGRLAADREARTGEVQIHRRS